MRPYGWAYMGVINTLEGVINPRPIVVECHKQNKSGILHYFLGTRKSACGSATHMGSFMSGQSQESTIIQDIENENDKYVKLSLICPECKIYYDNLGEEK
jgi:hypothetical protein